MNVVSRASFLIFTLNSLNIRQAQIVVKRESGERIIYMGYMGRAKVLSERLGSILNTALGMNSPVKIMTIVEIMVSKSNCPDVDPESRWLSGALSILAISIL